MNIIYPDGYLSERVDTCMSVCVTYVLHLNILNNSAEIKMNTEFEIAKKKVFTFGYKVLRLQFLLLLNTNIIHGL